MEKETTPPECTPETDGSADLELLRAISANPECAHVLAEIARGGDPAELIRTLMPAGESSPAPAATIAEDAPASPAAPGVAMFQSPSTHAEAPQTDSCPSFLTNLRPDFWQDDDFNF